MSVSTKYKEYIIRLHKDVDLAEWALGGIKRSYENPEYLEQFLDTAIRKLQDAKRDLQYFKNVQPPRPPHVPGPMPGGGIS